MRSLGSKANAHQEASVATGRHHTLTMASYEWKLNGCCGTEERIFLCFYAAYVVLFVFVSKTLVMKPMRLLAVFLHEFSHAAMAWLTGGKVTAIEVNENEGTVTICCGERRKYCKGNGARPTCQRLSLMVHIVLLFSCSNITIHVYSTQVV
jgi:Peptidase M50B-like